MKLPAYPRTKPSGVDWLGDVPETWEVKQLSKALIGIKDGTHGSFDRVPSSFPLLSAKNVTNTGLFLGDNESSISEEDHQSIVRCGYPRKKDLLITIVGTIGRSCVFQSDSPISFQRSVAFLRFTRSSEPQFFAYQVQSKFFQEQLQVRTKSAAQGGVYMGDLVKCPVFAPPVADQRSIAEFLDRETGRVDRLVAKKRELIERLKEKRTALISRTVTRGLPPAAARAAGLPVNPPLKTAALDWLGDIPSHWEVIPVRYAFYNLDHRRIPVAGEDRANVEKIYPYYGASGIIDHVEDYLFDETLILVAEDGANLLSRSTPLAFLATGKYWVNNHAHILKPVEGDIRYWAAVLQTYDYTPLVTGAAQPKLTSDRLGSIRLPKPPPEEQASIAAYLDEETAKLDALVGKVEEAVERLQEYRTALITAAVTGKIDVRAGVAPVSKTS